MDAALKKGVTLLVVVFVGWYIFTNPSSAASSAKVISTGLWSALQSGFTTMTTFLNALFA